MEPHARNSDERRLQRTSAGALASAYLAAASVLVFGYGAMNASGPLYWMFTGVSLLVFVCALGAHRLVREHVPGAKKTQARNDDSRRPDRASVRWAFTPEAWQSYPLYSGTLMVASYAGCVGLMTAFTAGDVSSAAGQTSVGYFVVAGLSLGLHEPARWAFRRQLLGLDQVS